MDYVVEFVDSNGNKHTANVENLERALDIDAKKAQMSLNLAAAKFNDATANANNAKVFYDALGEIRMALGAAGVRDGDTGMNERPPYDRAFEEGDLQRLRKRYFLILDACMRKMKVEPPTPGAE